ncbi:MAG: hypothetical protein RLN74_15820, partial [Ilumatobacter fluminis]
MTSATPDAIDAFRHDGAAVLRGAVDPATLAALADGVEYNRTHPSPWSHWYTNPDESVGFWSDYVTWRSVPQYEAAVFGSGLAEVAAALMGSDTVRFFHEHVLVKEPGSHRAHAMAPRPAVLLRRRRPERLDVDRTRSGARGSGRAVRRRVASLEPLVHPAQVRRPHAVRRRVGAVRA